MCFLFFSISVVNASCQTISPCNFPPNKHGRISIVGLRTDGRTYGVRTDKSDVIIKPKFLAFTGYQILLAMGLRCARLRRARELRYNPFLKQIQYPRTALRSESDPKQILNPSRSCDPKQNKKQQLLHMQHSKHPSHQKSQNIL